MKQCNLICDLQFGSTGKGLIAGWLAEQNRPDTVITAWGPNAGHTYINSAGRKFVHTMLANGIVSPNLRRILIGPGSIINMENLAKEIDSCKDLLTGAELYIHPNACVVTEHDRNVEAKGMVHIGSTMKGTGAVAIRRILRNPSDDPRACVMEDTGGHLGAIRQVLPVYTSQPAYSQALRDADVVQIEGAQGFSLSVYHGFWPYTTSRDCSPAQICADTGVAIQDVTQVIGCARTYPIRVANRYDEKGNEIGNSGPCYHDQKEISFADIGVEPELTTVTKLPRRIFTFSEQQLRDAVQVCRPGVVFMNFCNYLPEKERTKFMTTLRGIIGASTTLVMGWGPNVDDIVPF